MLPLKCAYFKLKSVTFIFKAKKGNVICVFSAKLHINVLDRFITKEVIIFVLLEHLVASCVSPMGCFGVSCMGCMSMLKL